ncbi:MAG: hypothetical protein ACI8WB_005161, partial [Phenylobacterium sp.]
MRIIDISKVCAAVACTLTLSTPTTIAAPATGLVDINAAPAAKGSIQLKRYIITFSPAAQHPQSKNGQAIFDVAAAKRTLIRHGGKVKVELPQHNAIAVELTPRAHKTLSIEATVVSIDLDPIRKFQTTYNDTVGNP